MTVFCKWLGKKGTDSAIALHILDLLDSSSEDDSLKNKKEVNFRFSRTVLLSSVALVSELTEEHARQNDYYLK